MAIMPAVSEYRAQVIQDGAVVASAYGSDFDAVRQEGEHYRLVYSQDGPADLKVSERRKGRWRLVGGAVAYEARAVLAAKVAA